MAEDEAVPSWLPDYILGVLKSPTWVYPVAAFKDEHCEMFEDVDEFTFSHTICHSNYKSLVMDLFEAHLAEVMIAPDEFERFCESGFEQHQQVHRTLAEHLMAVDDFLCFKAMMAKHAADLNAEVVAFHDDRDGEMPPHMALGELGLHMDQVADNVVATSIAQGIFGSGGAGGDWQDFDAEEEQLRLALAASCNDQESVEAHMKREEAALQQAIAMSLQLEEQRVTTLIETGQVSDEALGDALGDHYRHPVPPGVEAHLAAPSPASLPPTSLPSSDHLDQVIPTVFTIGPNVAPAALPPPTCGGPPEPVPLKALPPLKPPRPSAVAVAAEVEGLRQLRQRAEQVSVAPASTSAEARRQMAQQVAAQNAAAQGTSPVTRTGPSEEERRERAEHLRRNREGLKQKRALDRERQLEQFQQAKTAQAQAHGIDSTAHFAEEKIAAGRRLVAELTPGAVVVPTGTQQPDNAAAERMRQALTAQLRTSLARDWAPGAGALNAKVSQLESMKGSGGN